MRRDLRERLSPPTALTRQIEDTLDACARGARAQGVARRGDDVSQVLLLDRASGDTAAAVTLCYPVADAQPADGFISVLSPLGWRPRSACAWDKCRAGPRPRAANGAAEVLAILFQPEASGDYSM